jgi:hypothetical protein
MKRKSAVLVFLFHLLASLSISSPLWAAGIGFYLGYSYNSANLEGSPEYVPFDGVTPVTDALAFGIDELHHGQVGFAFDSAPLRDKLFNYRGNIGLDVATTEVQTGISSNQKRLTFYGVGHKSTFGFGILRTDTKTLLT